MATRGSAATLSFDPGALAVQPTAVTAQNVREFWLVCLVYYGVGWDRAEHHKDHRCSDCIEKAVAMLKPPAPPPVIDPNQSSMSLFVVKGRLYPSPRAAGAGAAAADDDLDDDDLAPPPAAAASTDLVAPPAAAASVGLVAPPAAEGLSVAVRSVMGCAVDEGSDAAAASKWPGWRFSNQSDSEHPGSPGAKVPTISACPPGLAGGSQPPCAQGWPT